MTRIHSFVRRPLSLLLVIAFGLALAACTKPQQGAPLPSVRIGVAEFTQPMTIADMLAGFIPEDTPRIDSKILPTLDEALMETLQRRTPRSYKGHEAYRNCRDAKAPNQGQGRIAALRHWVAVGQCMDVDFLIVPQIIEFNERQGGTAGVVTPAGIIMDIFLVDVRNPSVVRSHYNETQTALIDNLLKTDRFIARRGQWVTALDLAREGMEKAIKELGL